MRTCLLLVAAVVGSLMLASSARADGLQLIQTQGANYGPVVGETNPFNSFDPSLGTLNSVNVTINGTLTAAFQTVPLIDAEGDPIPEVVSAEIDQQFEGGGFSFETPTALILSGTTNGLGTPMTLVENYVYSFTVSANDLAGIVPLSYQNSIGGDFSAGTISTAVMTNLSDFVSPISGISLPIIEADVVTNPSTSPFLSGPALTDSGAILVTYNYTTNPVAAPGPSSVALLASGLLGLMGAGLYRKRLA